MSKTAAPLSAPWSLPAEEVLQALGSDAQRGLSKEEAARRLEQYGRNEIPEPEAEPFWLKYWNQLTGDAVVRLLLVGGIVSLLLGDWLEGSAIIAMLNIMAIFGLWQEGQASDAAASLRRADNPLTLAVRDGRRQDIPIAEIVPGDIVYLPTGAIAPADGRAIQSVRGEEDDSILTGEPPRPVITHPCPETAVVNDQDCMVFRGCGIVAGNVTAVITATGGATNVGLIAEQLEASEKSPTPLDEQLDELGDRMTQIFMWIAAIVIGAGLISHFWKESATFEGGFTGLLFSWRGLEILKESFINAVALIIAAIPEGLPAVLTITLAIATQVMVRRHALIRKPKAVEGGGSMNVLLTDKTGTLTANQMSVTHVYFNGQLLLVEEIENAPQSDPVLARIARIARLCNNSSGSTEIALSRFAEDTGLGLDDDFDRIAEHEFDQTLKRMTTVYSGGRGRHQVFTKGAPEQVLRLCRHVHLRGQDIPLDADQRSRIDEAVADLARRGLRVIALADREVPEANVFDRQHVEAGLTFVGLMGILDPPRDDVQPAVAKLAAAGVKTVMITGDNALTAFTVAKMVGIVGPGMAFEDVVLTGEQLVELENPTPEFHRKLQAVRVFARVTPDHKSKIVAALRGEGFIVGMTGDGVNDAIALKRSDVGFAMGNGTDVAREASDVVLLDSRFSTIPAAVEEGRNVLHRIRLYLSYILSGNSSEVGAFVAAYLIGVEIPLTALVLLLINFATDSFPALAMAFEPGDADVMLRPPRRRGQPFIGATMWTHIGVQTVVATLAIMVVYYYALHHLGLLGGSLSGHAAEAALAEARAAAFMTYIFQKLYRAFTARSLSKNIWEIGLFSNTWSIAAVALSGTLALISVYTPVINTAMGMAPLGWGLLGIAAVAGLICPFAEEITKLVLKGLRAPLAPPKDATVNAS